MSQTLSQTQTQNKTKPEAEKRYVVMDLLDLQPEEFSFGKPKANAYGGLMIPIKYRGKTLFVKYPKKTILFGVSANRDKGKMTTVNGEQRGELELVYGKGGKITGYSSSFSIGKDYENDPCFLKLKELDEFFMNACVDNCVTWRLGGTKTRPLSMEAVAGYDEYGQGGKWKRLLKYSYSVNKDQEREYRDYPPNYEVAVPANITDELNDDGRTKTQHAVFNAKFFDLTGADVGKVTDDNVDDVCPAFCESFTMARWSRISQGTYGASLKPRATQFRVYPRDEIDNSECMLGGEDEADEDEDLGEFEVTETLAADTVQTAEASEEDEGELLYSEGGDELVDEVEAVDPEPPTEAAPKRRIARRVVRKVTHN